MKTKKLKLINGNNNPYYLGLPKIVICSGHKWNDVALNHIKENTGLNFTETFGGMSAQPTSSDQIIKLFMTYNFKTRFYNNSMHHNTLMLKSDNHIGFEVNHICFDCCIENHIPVNGLKPGDKLAC
jgi:hypothetical protein